MKVCIDIQSAVSQRAGVGRYTSRLIQHFAPDPDRDSISLFFFDFKRLGSPISAPHAESHPIRWCPGRLAQFCWKKFRLPPFDLFAGEADVYHFPNFALPPMSSRKAATVVTIHDMSFMRLPLFAEERNERYLRRAIHQTAERADAIITVSRFSASEIRTLLNVSADRVFTVYSGIESDKFTPQPKDRIKRALSRMGIDGPYILTVGTIEPRKNIPLAVDVFERLSDFDGQLVIAGAAGWKYESILRRMRGSPRAGSIRWLEYVDDECLPSLYSGAELFLFPSFYEGFGFPPLESMACGTPVISSSGGSLPEVLGDAAVLAHGFETEEWVAAARKTLTDTTARTALVDKGRRQAAKYAWERAAAETWSVYRQIHAAKS